MLSSFLACPSSSATRHAQTLQSNGCSALGLASIRAGGGGVSGAFFPHHLLGPPRHGRRGVRVLSFHHPAAPGLKRKGKRCTRGTPLPPGLNPGCRPRGGVGESGCGTTRPMVPGQPSSPGAATLKTETWPPPRSPRQVAARGLPAGRRRPS